jgi:hypothetical protein
LAFTEREIFVYKEIESEDCFLEYVIKSNFLKHFLGRLKNYCIIFIVKEKFFYKESENEDFFSLA